MKRIDRKSSAVVMQRAKLLLTLKAMSVGPGKGTPGGMNLLAVCTNGQQQESKVRSWDALDSLPN